MHRRRPSTSCAPCPRATARRAPAARACLLSSLWRPRCEQTQVCNRTMCVCMLYAVMCVCVWPDAHSQMGTCRYGGAADERRGMAAFYCHLPRTQAGFSSSRRARSSCAFPVISRPWRAVTISSGSGIELGLSCDFCSEGMPQHRRSRESPHRTSTP